MNTRVIRTNLLGIPAAIGAALGLLGHSTAGAHHSANALYEMDSDFEIAGEVTEVRWNNPHVRVVMQVVDDGETQEWIVEGGDSSSMRARGVPGGLVEVGDSVRAAGRPGRRGKTAIFATNLLLADGREILMNAEAPPRWSDDIVGRSGDMMESGIPRREDASSGIFAVWSAPPGFDGDVEAGIWGGDIELTPEAAAIRDQFDPSADADNPFISCTRGIPEIMTGLGPLEFVDQGDHLLFRFQEFDIVRPIMMGPDAEANRPPKSEVGAHGDVGYSTGYWEDGTLVVRTTGMNFPYYDQSGLPQTSDAELVERWTLMDEGNELRYELTVTDPGTFVRPVVQAKTWHWAPNRQIEPFNCDPVQEL